MTDFAPFAKKVNERFMQLSKGELFVTVSGDALWDTYLKSFPEGTNNIYKTRTEYDCSCCKNFIRNIGPVVAIVDGKLHSIWDIADLEYPFNIVAKELNDLVVSTPITSLFRVSEKQYGSQKTSQLVGTTVINWNHFYGIVDAKHYTKSVGTVIGDYNSAIQVFSRGLKELSVGAIDDVIDLIQSKSLYRGEEHLPAINSFNVLLKKYNSLKTDMERSIFISGNAFSTGARFRNTVIGTLIQDISEGVELEKSVRSFEAKVAPTNYKRPTALITPRMVQDAMKTITELGLESALERRFAKISDVSVNNVLWVDNSVKGKMRDGVESILIDAATKKVDVDPKKTKDISIDSFMSDILPKATSIELLLSGSQQKNLMSLTAPVHTDSKSLFKWDNDFAWSYNGNITDSIKEKVKKAGGNVTNAAMRVSLAWFNHDDLDIHIKDPKGNHIYYANKFGCLDVDMNAGYGKTREPVENVSWISSNLLDGKYQVYVNQFSKRESSNVGFMIEVENQGTLTNLSYDRSVSGQVQVCTIKVKGKKITEIDIVDGIKSTSISQDVWGLKTEEFVRVNTMMYSPNYWDDNAVGNKHWFFMLEGCKNPDSTRGIYNEFLNPSLEKHRKVFEILGDKTKCQSVDEQLSGIGFSSTNSENIVAKVLVGKATMLYNIVF
jgi:hypothetical protein